MIATSDEDFAHNWFQLMVDTVGERSPWRPAPTSAFDRWFTSTVFHDSHGDPPTPWQDDQFQTVAYRQPLIEPDPEGVDGEAIPAVGPHNDHVRRYFQDVRRWQEVQDARDDAVLHWNAEAQARKRRVVARAATLHDAAVAAARRDALRRPGQGHSKETRKLVRQYKTARDMVHGWRRQDALLRQHAGMVAL